MAVVIYTEERGIYLGNCMGLGFWTKLDPIGQPSAVTFPDTATAEAHMAEWDEGRPDGATFVDVTPDAEGYASVQACVLAGLPAWMDEQTPVANTLPA